MKCLLIAYLQEGTNIQMLEGIMVYYGFGIIEQHKNFRVFTGHHEGNVSLLAEKLNHELEEMIFHIEDAIFIVYPKKNERGYPSLSNLIIKRKGNRYLRKNHLTD